MIHLELNEIKKKEKEKIQKKKIQRKIQKRNKNTTKEEKANYSR